MKYGLLERILNPKPYREQLSRERHKWEERIKLEEEKTKKIKNKERKNYRYALGMNGKRPIFLIKHLIGGGGSGISLYWEVELSYIEWEKPPYCEGYSTIQRIDKEWFGKWGANAEFERIKEYYNMVEIDGYYTNNKIKEVLGIDIKNY